MLNPRRGKPDIFVTSITGLLAGENFCHWAPWVKAHYWIKGDGEFDKATWLAEHSAMLQARASELKAEGYSVFLEKQNVFSLFGAFAKLSGKPDILAFRILDGGTIAESQSQALVSDVKTGARRLEHYWQVLTYLLVLPKVRPDLTGYTLRGELVYKDGIVRIEPHEATPDAWARIAEATREAGFTIPPERTPSEQECEFCSLSAADCPDKAAMVGTRASGQTTDF